MTKATMTALALLFCASFLIGGCGKKVPVRPPDTHIIH